LVRPWQVGPGGLVVSVRLTPKGGRDQVGGVDTLADGRVVLKARVRAAPVEGQANTALIGLLAKMLDVPRSKVTLVAGDISRIKRIEIAGNGAALAARLEQLLADDK
jgi:uncharacterized protein (TIGR00251 family)